MTDHWAEIAAWFTAAQWDIIALLFFGDCVIVHTRTARQYTNAVEAGNGRVIVAYYRRKISRWFMLGSGIALTLGLLRVLQLTIDPAPVPEFRLVGAVITEGIVIMLLAFWRAKRANRALQRVIDERRYEETGRRSQ